MTEPNPYTPPSSTELENPDRLWRTIEVMSLVVRNGAELPRISLENGDIGPDLVKSEMKYRDTGRSWINGLWGLSYFVIREISESIEKHFGFPVTSTLFAVGLVWVGLIFAIGRAQTRTTRFMWFIPPSLKRRLKWFTVGHNLLQYTGLVLILGSLFLPFESDDFERWETPALVTGIMLMIGSFFVRPFALLQIDLRGHPEGVRIDGINLGAIRQLREIENNHGRAA